jgi:hypothetical protein
MSGISCPRHSLRAWVHQLTEATEHFLDVVALPFDVGIAAEFLAEIVAGEDQRAAGVFLFAQAEKIRRVADLGLDLLLAVTEIVVGDER